MTVSSARCSRLTSSMVVPISWPDSTLVQFFMISRICAANQPPCRGNCSQPVERGDYPLLRDRDRGADGLGEEADPQFLDHPPHRLHVVAELGVGPEPGADVVVLLAHPVHDV